jgi:hypothetical protein
LSGRADIRKHVDALAHVLEKPSIYEDLDQRRREYENARVRKKKWPGAT